MKITGDRKEVFIAACNRCLDLVLTAREIGRESEIPGLTQSYDLIEKTRIKIAKEEELTPKEKGVLNLVLLAVKGELQKVLLNTEITIKGLTQLIFELNPGLESESQKVDSSENS